MADIKISADDAVEMAGLLQWDLFMQGKKAKVAQISLELKNRKIVDLEEALARVNEEISKLKNE